MFTPLLLLLACGGGENAGPDPLPAPTAGGLARREPLPPVAMQSCPEDTNLETAQTSSGGEQYCDRGGVLHGPYYAFYPSGEQRVRGSYDDGVMNGDWIEWHENGQERLKGRYVRGKETGPWTWWHPNGNRSEEGDFLQGRRAGKWTAWFESGAKKEEGMYHNGMKDGSWTYYNDDTEGSVARTERWENGILAEEHVTKPSAAVRTLTPKPTP